MTKESSQFPCKNSDTLGMKGPWWFREISVDPPLYKNKIIKSSKKEIQASSFPSSDWIGQLQPIFKIKAKLKHILGMHTYLTVVSVDFPQWLTDFVVTRDSHLFRVISVLNGRQQPCNFHAESPENLGSKKSSIPDIFGSLVSRPDPAVSAASPAYQTWQK